MSTVPLTTFAVCIENDGYEASLQRNKIYSVTEDADAGCDGDLRVVDESGEDYLYLAEWFIPIEIPEPVRQSVFQANA